MFPNKIPNLVLKKLGLGFGMNNPIPNFWNWEWEWKMLFPTFGIGNVKQCSQPNLENNWLKIIGIKFGTGNPANACHGIETEGEMNHSHMERDYFLQLIP